MTCKLCNSWIIDHELMLKGIRFSNQDPRINERTFRAAEAGRTSQGVRKAYDRYGRLEIWEPRDQGLVGEVYHDWHAGSAELQGSFSHGRKSRTTVSADAKLNDFDVSYLTKSTKQGKRTKHDASKAVLPAAEDPRNKRKVREKCAAYPITVRLTRWLVISRADGPDNE